MQNNKQIKQRFFRHFHFAIILILCTSLLLVGCNETGEEIDPTITLQYLAGDYATQLKNDGAEVLLGSVELTKNDGGEITIILHPKELIKDDGEKNSYRVDSFALNRTLLLPEQAYITFLPEDQSVGASILNPEEFYQVLSDEYKAHGDVFSQYGNFKLYDVYVLDDQALLLLAHYIPKAAF